MRLFVPLFVLLVAVSSASVAEAGDPTAGLTVDVRKIGAGLRRADPSATRVAARRPRMPAVLAASTEPARRARTEQHYTQLLAGFEQVVDKLHLPRRDVAVAAALYVGSAYSAQRGAQVTDAAILALVTQMRDVLAATPAFTRASMSEKQDMYEGLAMVGTLLAVAVNTNSGDPSLRDLGKTSLEAFVRGGLDTMQIDDRGLRHAGAAPAPAPARAAAAAPAPADAAPAGPAPKVTAILWSFKLDYDPLSSSMVNREDVYLLFPDGSCTSDVPARLDGFDPAASRAAHPKRWGRWRKSRSSYEVAFGGGMYSTPPKQTVLRGAKRGERLAGTWSRSRTGGVGGANTWQSNTLVLKADGRFERARAGAFTSNSDVNHPDTEVIVSGAYDDDGTTATISGPNVGGGMRTPSGRTAADRSGTYVLDGHTIELRYAGGAVERHLFGISTDPKHNFLRLGNDIMTR